MEEGDSDDDQLVEHDDGRRHSRESRGRAARPINCRDVLYVISALISGPTTPLARKSRAPRHATLSTRRRVRREARTAAPGKHQHALFHSLARRRNNQHRAAARPPIDRQEVRRMRWLLLMLMAGWLRLLLHTQT